MKQRQTIFLLSVMLSLVFLATTQQAFAKKKEAKMEAAVEAVVEEKVAEMTAEHTAGGDKMMMDEEVMKKWQEYSTPGEGHAALNPLVGNWDYTMKHWMSADASAEESTGTSESKWILGGRFVEQFVNGTAMGQPFEGRGIVGYDNSKKAYDSIWLDNMSTGLMTSSAAYDSATKVLEEKGSFFCPMINGQRTFRAVTKITDDNSHIYEMYMTDEKGVEFKAMEINYKRKS